MHQPIGLDGRTRLDGEGELLVAGATPARGVDFGSCLQDGSDAENIPDSIPPVGLAAHLGSEVGFDSGEGMRHPYIGRPRRQSDLVGGGQTLQGGFCCLLGKGEVVGNFAGCGRGSACGEGLVDKMPDVFIEFLHFVFLCQTY